MDIKTPVDMNPADVIGEYQERAINLYGGGQRKVYVTNIETPFPEGKLIVSVSDLEGVITQANKAFVDMSGYDKEELMGQPHTIIRHPDMQKRRIKIYGKPCKQAISGMAM